MREFESNYRTNQEPNFVKIIENYDKLASIGIQSLKEVAIYAAETLSNPEFEAQIVDMVNIVKPAMVEVFTIVQDTVTQLRKRMEELDNEPRFADIDGKMDTDSAKFKKTFSKKFNVFAAKMYIFGDKLETLADSCLDTIKTKIKYRHS